MNAEFGIVFFAAFAPLREIFRLLVAALLRYALCGELHHPSLSEVFDT
jgi:hypothetical protein